MNVNENESNNKLKILSDKCVLTSKENIIDSASKTRQLPNWLKRAPSEHDIKKSSEELEDKKSATENENKKFKKKPKLNI